MRFFLKIFIFVALFSVVACSTKKNTWVARNYHSLTAHYNGLWMADEIVKETEKNTAKNFKDDYEKVLPIFTYTRLDEVKTVTPEMEKAYKRASKVIQYHSMLIRDVEYNPWIKNTYVLIGRTHFHKHDYFAGLEAFEYVVSKNKKHPYKFEAMMWMLRTYNETGLFSSSQGLIDLILDEKAFPKKYKSEFNSIVADFYLKQEDYTKAIEFLEPAFKTCKNRKLKGRFAYILAQLYQKSGDGDNAVKYFDKSLNYGPSYDMAFNATLNLAKSKAISGGNAKEIKKMFLEMLTQEKYKEYNDQIYYSLAELSEKQNEIKDEEFYLVESVKISKSNKNQKGLSSLKLAELYFTQTKYEIAQLYYDTAVDNLNKDFPDYFVVENKQKSLKTLVGYIKVIEQEDSLQKVGRLSDTERKAMVDKIIADKKKRIEEEKKKLEEQKAILESNKALQENLPTGMPGFGGGPPLGAASTQWYYYNPATLSFGLSEFQKRWGNRKLEDNWRRSNKEIVANTETEESNDTANAKGESGVKEKLADLTPEQLDEKEKEKYLKNIPSTAEQFTASTNKIIDAYYNCGTLYKEQLNDFVNAANTFEKLQKNYTDNKYNLVTHYQLYRLYLAIPDSIKAEKYKNLILTKFPDSEYAAIINNPDINAQKQFSKNKEDIYYEETYNSYLAKDYLTTKQKCQNVDSLFPKSIYKPKYALLSALATGGLESAQAMIAALKIVVASYPKDPVKDKAAEIIEILEKNPSLKNAEAEIKKSIFNKSDNDEHYYVIQMPMSADQNKLKLAISKFNEDNFGILGLKMEDLVFNDNKKMIVVKGLENATKAMNYFNIIKDNAKISGSLAPSTFQQFVISVSNYTTLLKNQTETQTYSSFFQENYLKI